MNSVFFRFRIEMTFSGRANSRQAATPCGLGDLERKVYFLFKVYVEYSDSCFSLILSRFLLKNLAPLRLCGTFLCEWDDLDV